MEIDVMEIRNLGCPQRSENNNFSFLSCAKNIYLILALIHQKAAEYESNKLEDDNKKAYADGLVSGFMEIANEDAIDGKLKALKEFLNGLLKEKGVIAEDLSGLQSFVQKLTTAITKIQDLQSKIKKVEDSLKKCSKSSFKKFLSFIFGNGSEKDLLTKLMSKNQSDLSELTVGIKGKAMSSVEEIKDNFSTLASKLKADFNNLNQLLDNIMMSEVDNN